MPGAGGQYPDRRTGQFARIAAIGTARVERWREENIVGKIMQPRTPCAPRAQARGTVLNWKAACDLVGQRREAPA
jgi:hypothetical protein